MSGGPGPIAFKGFENGSATPTCGSTWTSEPGNSSNPSTDRAAVHGNNTVELGATEPGCYYWERKKDNRGPD